MQIIPNHIILTTINIPTVLEEVYENVSKFGHLHETCVWVIPDKKTPADAKEYSEKISKKGLTTFFVNIENQDVWGARNIEFYSSIPYNNETRRNIGYLMALEAGCERLISIDDDNWPGEDDFIGLHMQTGQRPESGSLKYTDPSGFYNVCEHLDVAPHRHIYPRGFPFKLRNSRNSATGSIVSEDLIIGVTAGLWTKEPDIDAITWLNGSVEATRYNDSRSRILLSQNTWTPINTQNTSVIRELVPGFLCIPMGFAMPGGQIQRYGDIWAGYFLQAVMAGTNYLISFGRPMVEHRRNPHNYLDDLRGEYWGMLLTDWLVEELRANFKPTASTVDARMLELAEFLVSDGIDKLPKWCPVEAVEFIRSTSKSIKEWIYVCRKVL